MKNEKCSTLMLPKKFKKLYFLYLLCKIESFFLMKFMSNSFFTDKSWILYSMQVECYENLL